MVTRFSTTAPEPPVDADFALYFEFEKDTEHPERIFQAADQAIRSFRRLDHILCATVDSNIKPVLVLEEIEAGSIKVWLRNILERIDDDALKNLDWKPAVGRYLVKAKYAIIDWSNGEIDLNSIQRVRERVRRLAEETGIKRLPFYGELSTKDVVEAAASIDKTKRLLEKSDSLKYVTREDEVEFNMEVDIHPETIQEIITRETISSADNLMILAVKKPDYLGNSMWDLRYGNKTISATIEDEAWLRDFQSRKTDVRPGDALRCSVRIEARYGHDNELLGESYIITKVLEVLEDSIHRQADITDES